MKKNIKLWGALEGASYLILLFIAMPLKYVLDMPLAVKYVGWAHGVLFIVFNLLLLIALIKKIITFKQALLGFISSLLPFGPFYFDKKIMK